MWYVSICIFDTTNYMKKKLKLKTSNNKFFNKLKAPFLNRNNQIVLASFLILLSLYLIIAFTSFLIK